MSIAPRVARNDDDHSSSQGLLGISFKNLAANFVSMEVDNDNSYNYSNIARDKYGRLVVSKEYGREMMIEHLATIYEEKYLYTYSTDRLKKLFNKEFEDNQKFKLAKSRVKRNKSLENSI